MNITINVANPKGSKNQSVEVMVNGVSVLNTTVDEIKRQQRKAYSQSYYQRNKEYLQTYYRERYHLIKDNKRNTRSW